jgi:hypothetical protein
VRAAPRWVWGLAGLVVLLALLGGLGYLAYGALDRLYPQDLWRYFRPVAPGTGGSVLYLDREGRLVLAPVVDTGQGRTLSAGPGEAGPPEVVRDAAVLPDGRTLAYFASQKRTGQPDGDHLKLVGLDGTPVQDLVLAGAAGGAGEPLLPAVYVSASGRYLALTSRDRARVYYYDAAAGGALTPGPADAPPERMLWYRNGDLRTGPFPDRPAYALSPDGRRRAEVRAGARRAPECDETPRCEAVQELSVVPATVTGVSRGGVPLYGAFADFSADGWGPIPAQPAASLYGRLVWSPDGTQLLFTALDGADSRVYAISADGRTRPRLLLQGAEALDWIP